MSDLSVGDIVKLKSGGPNMTVSDTSSVYQIHVLWICEDGTTQEMIADRACFIVMSSAQDAS